MQDKREVRRKCGNVALACCAATGFPMGVGCLRELEPKPKRSNEVVDYVKFAKCS
jgi:hypothetical protein